MAPKCCIPGCYSNYTSTIEETGYVTVFRFPTDADRAALWLKFIPRKDWKPSKHSVVCVKHFAEKDLSYVDVSIDKEGNVQRFPRHKCRLKPEAIPSIFPALPQLSKKPSSSAQVKPKRKKQYLYRKEKPQNDWLEKDTIKSLSEFLPRMEELKKHMSHNWRAFIDSNFVCLYVLDFETIPKVNVSVKIGTDMGIQVCIDGNILSSSQLSWIISGGKLQRWTQLQNLLARLDNEIKSSSIIRCSNSSVMDTKERDPLSVREGDPISNTASQNEKKYFPKDVAVKTNSDSVLVDQGCEMAIKTEMKLEDPSPEYCFQQNTEPNTEHSIKYETVTYKSEIDTKIDTEEQTLNTDVGSQNGREFIAEDSVMKVEKHCSDHEENNGEEHWCLETKSSCVYDEIKDKDFPPTESPRICTEAVSGHSSGESSLPFVDDLAIFSNAMDNLEYENQESFFRSIPPVKSHVDGEQSDKLNDSEELYTRTLDMKKDGLIHNQKTSHKCNVCGKSFTRRSHLKRHILIHEDKKSHKCNICEKSFTLLQQLKEHNLIHEGQLPHKCEVCEKRFTRLTLLKAHKVVHEGKRPHKCEICEKRFPLLSYLRKHSLIHIDKRPYSCKICKMSFTHSSNLKRHSWIHEGKRPYKCEICEKGFTDLYNLKLHNLIHEGKKRYKCDICEKSFIASQTFKTHIWAHEGKKPYTCETCGKNFTRLSDLNRHKFIHEEKRFKCDVCGKYFRWLASFKNHNLAHQLNNYMRPVFIYIPSGASSISEGKGK